MPTGSLLVPVRPKTEADGVTFSQRCHLYE